MSALPHPPIIGNRDGETVSPALEPLLLGVFVALAEHRPPLAVADAIEPLLTFLASPAGRTNANCWAADLFFCLDDGWGDTNWEYLPEDLGDILGDMGSALHDTVQSPDVAAEFNCTPEQLLDRLRQVRMRAV